MHFFDSHCHLDDSSYTKDFEKMIDRAKEAGVTGMMTVGVTERSSEICVHVAEQYDGVYASVGIHPHDAKECSEEVLKHLEKLSKSSKVKAWGETGLDFNRMHSPKNVQEKWFIRQLEYAYRLDLPLIFHERDSEGRFLEILKHHEVKNRRGVVHCFSGDKKELESYLDLGLYIGITGIITMNERGETLRDLVRYIPSDRILIETDAPYLTPAPHKNKTRRNEPSFVPAVLLKIAEVLEKDSKTIAESIWDNTCELYGI
ncbi:TatD family hydrolase [Desulforegula conservatrix]|uniref:TatD family hydrolase n=1 Tax=Desulforegula conservatrix TaxID=153026 RepID=UPI0004221BFD|nr:TatD family hydrolase [Desulforegula conservatrix]